MREIDFDKVQNVEDIKNIFKVLDFKFGNKYPKLELIKYLLLKEDKN